jgi:pimeloyl-ACP methyl ester carboxylesterase
VKSRIVVATITLLALTHPAPAALLTRWFPAPYQLDRVNSALQGRVLDYTHNHGSDHRIDSPALGQKRDLYVYVPPNFDPCQSYPLVIFMHGFGFDENCFLQLVGQFDTAMACGSLPPAIVAAPDGSIGGRATLRNGGSFFVNSKAGRFEDYLMQDVWGFLHQRFSIRPEREAHALIGGSMGGFAAYNLGIKYRDRVGVVAGIFPPLNLRYMDCHGRYFSKFDPDCLGWRTELQPLAPVGRYAGGLITIRERRLLKPLFGRDPTALEQIARENPVEMLDLYDVKPGELEMFIAYVGHDAFNINAQVESFLWIARSKGFTITSLYMPEGRHNMKSGLKLTPALLEWMAPRLEPFRSQPTH